MRVLISGAGVAGPTLAYFLARIGAHVTIVEKVKELLPHGQNVDMEGAAITVIKKMGLLDEVKRNNTKEKGTCFIDPKGRSFAAFPVPDKDTKLSLTSEFEILRGDLAVILHKASATHPNVKYLFDTTVKKIITNNDESVKVELSSGDVQEFDLLVAADGQWSRVRKQCFLPETIDVVDTGMYAIYFTLLRLPEDDDWWNIYLGINSRCITLRPDPYGTIRAILSYMPLNEAERLIWQEASKSGRQVQEKLVRKTFADAGWQAQRIVDAMDQAPDFYFHVIQQIKMDKWSSNRVICLGDAAYAPSPLTGGGTSLALTGAYVLAAELSKLPEGEHPSRALENYETTFRPHAEAKQKIPFVFPWIAHPQQAWKRWLIHLLVRMLAQLAQLFSFGGNGESRDDGFPLPRYPEFEEKVQSSQKSPS